MNATVVTIAESSAPVPGPSGRAETASAAPSSAVQVGALCWRRHRKGVQVLLITSRETGRWVIPKGGIVSGKDAGTSAALEAWEEAGVEGELATGVLGCFDYDKLYRKRQEARRCEVQVYPLRVERLAAKFPERGQRRRKWFKPAKAAGQVMEPALRDLLAALAEDASPLTGTGDRTDP